MSEKKVLVTVAPFTTDIPGWVQVMVDEQEIELRKTTNDYAAWEQDPNDAIRLSSITVYYQFNPFYVDPTAPVGNTSGPADSPLSPAATFEVGEGSYPYIINVETDDGRQGVLINQDGLSYPPHVTQLAAGPRIKIVSGIPA